MLVMGSVGSSNFLRWQCTTSENAAWLHEMNCCFAMATKTRCFAAGIPRLPKVSSQSEFEVAQHMH